MNRQDLIDAVYDMGVSPKKLAGQVVDKVLDVVKDGAAIDQVVRLPGFGTFSVTRREGRTCRNPQTGKQMMSKPKNVIKFKPASAFHDQVQ